MSIFISTQFSIFLYLTAALLQIWHGFISPRPRQWAAWLLGICAVIIHAALLHIWIDTPNGQNLSIFNVCSLMIWVMTSIILISALTQPVQNLCLFLFPAAALSIPLATHMPVALSVIAHQDAASLTHIIVSLLALSLTAMAGLQALFLWWHNRVLRSHQPGRLLRILPPLSTMETLLFQIIRLSFIILSFALASGIWFIYPAPFTSLIVQKFAFSLIAWGLFGLLLFGHACWGWRGRFVVNWTLIAVASLALGYIGFKVLSIT